MKKTWKRFLLFTALSLFAVIGVSVFAGCNIATELFYGNCFLTPEDKANYEESEEYDRRMRKDAHIPSLDEDFKEDRVVIILDGKHSGTGVPGSVYNYYRVAMALGRVENLDAFGVTELFGAKSFKGAAPTYRVILEVKLKVPGKEKVVEALIALQSVDMVLVAEASYNYYVDFDI